LVTCLHIASLCSSSTCGNAYLVWDDASRPVLVDCGITLKRLTECLSSLGMKPSDLAALFITHEHSDHIKSMCLRTPVSQKFGIPVFASAGFWDWYEDHMGCYCYLERDLRRVLEPFETVKLPGGPSVTAFPKPHDAVEPYGFVVEYGGERAGFAMDLGHVPERIEGVLRGLTHLVFESNHDVEMEKQSGRPYYLIRRVLSDLGHLSNDQAAKSLSRLVTKDTRQVILAHLSLDCNTPELALSSAGAALRDAGRTPALYAAPAGEMAVYGD